MNLISSFWFVLSDNGINFWWRIWCELFLWEEFFCSRELLSNLSGSHWCSASLSPSLHLIFQLACACVSAKRLARLLSFMAVVSTPGYLLKTLCSMRVQEPSRAFTMRFFLGAAHYVHVGALLNEATCSLLWSYWSGNRGHAFYYRFILIPEAIIKYFITQEYLCILFLLAMKKLELNIKTQRRIHNSSARKYHFASSKIMIFPAAFPAISSFRSSRAKVSAARENLF